MTDHINKNDDDNDLGYTPVLSKYFPSFAGVVTPDERRATVKAVLLLLVFLPILFIWGLFFSFSALFSIAWGIDLKFIILSLLGIGLIRVFYKYAGKPLAVNIVKDFHAHGKSFTCWVLVPVMLYLILVTICVIFFDAIKDNILNNIESLKDMDKGKFIFMALCMPPIIFVCVGGDVLSDLFGKKTSYAIKAEAKAAHTNNSAARALVNRMQRDRANAASTPSVRPVVPKTNVRTTSTVARPTIQKPVRPTPPAPPSHQ